MNGLRSSTQTTRTTILLVEDEMIIAMDRKMHLERAGYAVVIARNGTDAVKEIKRNAAICLVLMDITLGSGPDGIETADLVLQERHVPIIFLSNRADVETIARVQMISSHGFVPKTTNETLLLHMIAASVSEC